jgi:16S rRNA (guanine527-N7)-methyltransferase
MTDAMEISGHLRAVAARWGVALSDDAEDKLVRYALELARWNQRINLIRFRDWRELVDRHLADGFAASHFIPVDARSLVDVGAGAGIPGALVAALCPQIEVRALEPIHKKHAFLRSLRRTLPIRNFTPDAARLGGSDEPDGLGGRFDVAVSRATWSISEWLERGQRLVRPGGLVLGLEGREVEDLPPGSSRHPYEADGRRRAVIALRIDSPLLR